ncbi:hypothetical protein O181_061257 [Austropuccinia psidii MF-1]|uniref:Uncharacterized protein n=1 Tax=Austropuccinia psidii MF-1 TaxID=1389203 RepID=A0A9Q3EKA4_9BASI|nr:hypothetical protein [Austropuccinia psidii MF-1]
MYGIDLHNNKDRYFTIGDKKPQKFALLPFKRQIILSKVAQVKLELERYKSEQLNEAEISLHLTDNQENKLSALLYDHREAFASDKEPLGAIIGHEVESSLILRDLIHHSQEDMHIQQVPNQEKLWKYILNNF